MAQDLNQVTLIARLVADPELRALPSGTSVCSMRVAFNTSRKTPDGWEDQGNFINVTVWGRQAENAARVLTRGQRIGILGRLEHRTWQDAEGNRREAHQIVADRIQYLDPRANGSGQATTPAAAPAAQVDEDDVPF